QAKSDPTARETAGHVVEGLALLLELQDRWPPRWAGLIGELCSWFKSDEQACQMLVASISHHGRPVSLKDYGASSVDRVAARWWGASPEYDPMSALDSLADAARLLFPDAFVAGVPAIDATPGLQQRFAGLVMLADWIGSDTQFFPYRQSPGEDRHSLARSAADRALRAIGLFLDGPRASR